MVFHLYININISVILNDDGTLFHPYFDFFEVIWNVKVDTYNNWHLISFVCI